MIACASPGEHCTHYEKKTLRLSQRPEFEALVLLYCCCAVLLHQVVCTVASRLLLYIVLLPAQDPIHCTSLESMCSFLFLRSTENVATRTPRFTV